MITFDETKRELRLNLPSAHEGERLRFTKKLDAPKGNRDALDCTMQELEQLRVLIYTMVGGSLLGDSAITQPADFYIDSRVGKLPYPKRQIMAAVALLHAMAVKLGLDPHRLPELRVNYTGWFWDS